jgi:hypothetical protein
MTQFKHLTRGGQMKALTDKLFAIEIRFANRNANFTVTLPAKSKANALWVAAEWRSQQPAWVQEGFIGNIDRVRA